MKQTKPRSHEVHEVCDLNIHWRDEKWPQTKHSSLYEVMRRL